MSLRETHQAHLTHLIFVILLHYNPSSVSLLLTRPYALTQLESDMPSHVQLCMETYLWQYCILSGRPKEHHQGSLTNPFY